VLNGPASGFIPEPEGKPLPLGPDKKASSLVLGQRGSDEGSEKMGQSGVDPI
jgi:hypothetical protein